MEEPTTAPEDEYKDNTYICILNYWAKNLWGERRCDSHPLCGGCHLLQNSNFCQIFYFRKRQKRKIGVEGVCAARTKAVLP